jgi:hypothetical protein
VERCGGCPCTCCLAAAKAPIASAAGGVRTYRIVGCAAVGLRWGRQRCPRGAALAAGGGAVDGGGPTCGHLRAGEAPRDVLAARVAMPI